MDYLALAFGLVLMMLGANYFVEYAVGLAKQLRLHAAIFGAVIVAIGTSLPELVVTLTALRKKEHGLAIGNVIGSNLFNIALIGGTGATITNSPISLQKSLVSFINRPCVINDGAAPVK